MKNKFLLLLASVMTMLLVACGGDGPTLGAFPAITKTVGDEAFTLTAPTSKGPGAFSYTSSNAEVATISGNTVTIVGAGTSTITVTQAAVGSYNQSTTTAVLTVNPRACVAPATRQGTACVAPATTATSVTSGGRTWMPVTFLETWANANSYCIATTINGSTGWRLPTETELSDLHTSGAMKDHGWELARTWSSTEGAIAGQRKTVRLDGGIVGEEAETARSYVACVK